VYRLRLLGAVDLRDGGGGELRTVLAQPKRVALLAYLALAAPRGAHRRDKLLALFWPEHDAERARNALNQALHFLRRTIGAGALLSRTAEEVALETGEVWCDAVAFEAALDAGQVTEALELYRGDLLDAFHAADTGVEFERWLDAERKRLAQRYAAAVERVATEREDVGDFDGAVLWWRRLAARDPYSPRVTLRLMRALAAAGDPAAAIRHARVHENLLRADLEAGPDREVTALVEQLKSAPAVSGQPRLAAPPLPAVRDASTLSRRARLLASVGVLVLVVVGALVLRAGITASAYPPIRSLAVLPLENLSEDTMQQSFVDGMHDVLITELARYPELSVISRTSVLRYRNADKHVSEIAAELNVDGIVEGTVVRAGGRVRITAQLVQGTSDRHVWAERYERDLGDVLPLQAEIAEAIAREVRVAADPLPRTTRGVGSSRPADSVPQELYLRELYLRGRHAELSRSPIGIQTAKEAYRRAIARDSTFALGYAGLAGVYGFEANYLFAPVAPALDSARLMARKAVALDSLHPDTRTALGVTLGELHQWEAAEREFKRAIELGPSNARAHYYYSMLLVVLGHGEEALREARRALELDPFAPRVALAMERYATFLTTGARPHFQLAVTERRPILKLEPGEPWARAREAVELGLEGRCDEGRVELDRARQLVPANNLRMLPFVGDLYWVCGERWRARGILAAMKRDPAIMNHGWFVAWLHTRFGEHDSAFAWLERDRWSMADLSNLSAGWVTDPLRSDPRYPALLRRLGIRSR
jgi:TolB-like protein/DNA-binding SARP family transcriptional activator/Flp pilus assembly protein TadD